MAVVSRQDHAEQSVSSSVAPAWIVFRDRELIQDHLLMYVKLKFQILSPREAERCSLLAHRLSTVEISACLLISPRTVEKLVESIFKKFAVGSREHLRLKIGIPAPAVLSADMRHSGSRLGLGRRRGP
jgi:DNA-binding CsgD family transcriptional regulator